VIGGHEFGTVKITKTSVERCNAGLCIQEGLGGEVAQCDNYFGLNHLNLSEKKGIAGEDLIHFGVAIVRRTAFDDVGDIDLLPF